MSTLSGEQIDRIVQTHGAGMRRVLEDADAQRSSGRPPIYPNGGQVPSDRDKSIGEAFVASDAYRGWVERFPSGGPSGPGEYRSDPVEIRLSMRDASRQLKARSLITASDSSGGALADAQFVGLLAGRLVRPPSCATC